MCQRRWQLASSKFIIRNTSFSQTRWNLFQLEKLAKISSPVENCTRQFFSPPKMIKYTNPHFKISWYLSIPTEFPDLKTMELKSPVSYDKHVDINSHWVSVLYFYLHWKNPTGSLRRGCCAVRPWQKRLSIISAVFSMILYFFFPLIAPTWGKFVIHINKLNMNINY